MLYNANYHVGNRYDGIVEFDRYLSTCPTFPVEPKNNDDDLVSFNGVNYSKKIFESIIDTSIANFVENLEIETMLNSYEDTAGVVENVSNEML
jgi:hypothetical protein